ncbi:methionine--tRNA ligase [Candidatus Woesearchaeota archaeon]|nr:methionine--tRNA ligase [Candidatus Woesearchaeota archaeon]
MNSYYITTAIDYPNGRPHMGHAYEKIIADALARWQRLHQQQVFSLTGTDENSQKIVEKAEKEGIPTKEFLDRNVTLFKELCEKLDTSFDNFIRTTLPEHKKTAQELFTKVYEKGDIYKGTYKGLYCVGCERFYTEKDLDDGKCPVHLETVKQLEEESYFFTLSKYQERLIKHIEDHPEFIQPAHKRNEILNRLKEPLQDLSVSRTSISWGIPVPFDKKHVIYVWFDALINYLSGIDYPSQTFRTFWPCNVHIIGKDITWFHTVIWPIMLMAADIPLPIAVHSHGFVNLKGEKLSKSRGIIVDPLSLIEEYGSDSMRYYLLREIPAGQDGDFSEEALVERANADLADALGNLVNRACVMINKYCEGKIPTPGRASALEVHLEERLTSAFQAADKAMNSLHWHRAAEYIWQFIHDVNKYVNDSAPWKLDNEQQRATVLYYLVEAIRNITLLTHSFVPRLSERIAHMIDQDITHFADLGFQSTTTGTIDTPAIVFSKLSVKQVDPFSKVLLKVGVIQDVTDHPNADKLYILKVQIGQEERQLVAGIKSFFTKEELRGKHIVIVANLKPATLRGVESQGMLLAAEKAHDVVLIEAPHTPSGEQVMVEGISSAGGQITFDEFSKITLTTKDHKVLYKDKFLHSSQGPITADIADGARIR